VYITSDIRLTQIKPSHKNISKNTDTTQSN